MTFNKPVLASDVDFDEICFFDAETVGFHGLPVLMQYAFGDEDIELYSPFNEEFGATIELLEDLVKYAYCGFNNTFDIFHIVKTLNVWRRYAEEFDAGDLPIENIERIAEIEPLARGGQEGFDCKAWVPKHQLDLMLYARKGPYQSTMDRKDIRIRRVPYKLAQPLADKLNELVPLKDIYFERSKDKTRWRPLDIKDDDGEIIRDFQDVVLKFAPSSALKALAVDALGLDSVIKFEDNDLPKAQGLGYAPFALAGWKAQGKKEVQVPNKIITRSGTEYWSWGETWPKYVRQHIDYWEYDSLGRKYAEDDIVYLRKLFRHFQDNQLEGIPFVFDHDDDVLATSVANVRWVGYSADLDALNALVADAQEKKKNTPTAPAAVKDWIEEDLDPIEQISVTGTSKQILESVSKWEIEDDDDRAIEVDGRRWHPAAYKASQVIEARRAEKEINLFNKIIHAGRFHASFKVIGTLSSRMAGADGLNPQGINREGKSRSCFNMLVDNDHILKGGDFDAFELGLMDSVYHDPKMHRELTGDKKLHALWGERYFFPHMTYDEISATKGELKDFYTLSKNGVFAICYFGEDYTLTTRVGIDESTANDAYHKILKDYPTFAEKRRFVVDMFCSMKQPKGLGTAVEWHDPKNFVESLFGFRRYFTLENTICKVLFDLAQDVPEEWRKLDIQVIRRDKVQQAAGAVMSALYGAAFQIQGSNMRAAGNHLIQSSGSTITKSLQRRLWDLQPVGIHNFQIAPFNAHDEVLSSMVKELEQSSYDVVNSTLEEYREKVPLLAFHWETLRNWSEKQ